MVNYQRIEKEMMKQIKEHLKCRFIRYNQKTSTFKEY